MNKISDTDTVMSEPDFIRRLNKIDLNLLTVLHALLETGSTQGAALRLGRTQSAASHSLKRLRAHFDDPLFTRNGPVLTPTALALALKQPLANLLGEAVSLVESGTTFDPVTSTREVVVAAPDICFGHAQRVCQRLADAGPRLRLRTTGASNGVDRLVRGEVDVLFTLYRDQFPAAATAYVLPNAHWSTLVRQDHPIKSKPTLGEWANFDHVQVHTGKGGRSPINDALAVAGADRRVALKVDTFLSALHATASSDLLFTTMADLAAQHASQLGLRRVALPIDVFPVPFRAVLRNRSSDSFSKWLRTTLTADEDVFGLDGSN